MNVWHVVVAVGAGSYLFRMSMVVLVERIGTPAILARASAFVVPSAFAALAAGSVVASSRSVDAVHAIPPLAALTVAIVAVRRSGSPYTAIAVGMPTLWVLTALLPG